MDTTPPPLDFDYQSGFKIATKHKEAIRQLYGFVGKLVEELMARYKLSKSTILHILSYEHPEHARPTWIGRLLELTDSQINTIIEYLSETYKN